MSLKFFLQINRHIKEEKKLVIKKTLCIFSLHLYYKLLDESTALYPKFETVELTRMRHFIHGKEKKL